METDKEHKRILVFDIDDTLIYSNANVYVVKDNVIVKTLSASQFNTYVLRPYEHFDFRDFDSPKLLTQARLTKYWNTLKREYGKGSDIAILTARSSNSNVKNFLINHGVNIDDNLIFCCGDSNFPYKGEIQYKKTKVIEYLHKIGYETFIFFDDNEKTLNTAKRLEKLYNIDVIIVKPEI